MAIESYLMLCSKFIRQRYNDICFYCGKSILWNSIFSDNEDDNYSTCYPICNKCKEKIKYECTYPNPPEVSNFLKLKNYKENITQRYKKRGKGWIYVLVNKAMPNLVKIGYTRRTPDERAKEIEGTGVPYSYEVIYQIPVEYPEFFEKKIHLYLNDKQVGKEWFRCSTHEAIATIKMIVKNEFKDEQIKRLQKEKIDLILENIYKKEVIIKEYLIQKERIIEQCKIERRRYEDYFKEEKKKIIRKYINYEQDKKRIERRQELASSGYRSSLLGFFPTYRGLYRYDICIFILIVSTFGVVNKFRTTVI